MGKYKKYLHYQVQILTHLANFKARHLCKVLRIYLTANKSYGQKMCWHKKPAYTSMVYCAQLISLSVGSLQWCLCNCFKLTDINNQAVNFVTIKPEYIMVVRGYMATTTAGCCTTLTLCPPYPPPHLPLWWGAALTATRCYGNIQKCAARVCTIVW